MANETPEEKLAQTRALQEISQRYLNRDDNPDLDPYRQDQIDKNVSRASPQDTAQVPFSPMSAAPDTRAESRVGGMPRGLPAVMQKSLAERPYATLLLGGLLGFVLGAVWKS